MTRIALVVMLVANATPQPRSSEAPAQGAGDTETATLEELLDELDEPPAPKGNSSGAEPEKNPVTSHANVELGLRALPGSVSETSEGERFLYFVPSMSFESREVPFALALQLPLSLVPRGGLLSFKRYEVAGHDWDLASNYGQIVKELVVGRPGEDAVAVRAGAMGGYTLGQGYLVQNYDNRVVLGYAPLSFEVAVAAGGLATVRFFGSDAYFLNPRVFALDAAFRLLKIIELSPSIVWDSGGSGELNSNAMGASALGARVHIVSDTVDWSVTGGLGTRWGEGRPDVGMTVGTWMRVGQDTSVQLHIEHRWNQSDHFRFGLIGADYELRRALAGQPLDAESRSLYVELAVQVGSVRSSTDPRFRLSMAAEGWGDLVGRTNVAFSTDLLGGRLSATARWVRSTMGERPYHDMQARMVYRFNWYGFYLWASGGTVHALLPAVPASDAPQELTVANGLTGSGGAGVQFGE